MWVKDFLHDQNNWWFGHLHEQAARGCGEEDCDYISLLENVFKVTPESNTRYWTDIMNMDDESGYYPQIHFGLPEGHVVSVVYSGKPRYDIQYRYGAPTGESYLVAVEDGQNVLPGFRWAEVKAISSFMPHIANLALLSLLPAADVSADEKTEAESEIQRALIELGFDSPDIKPLAELLVESISYNTDWFYDESYGWITNDYTCWRYPKRSENGLTNTRPEFFSDFKTFTGFLKLNK